MAKRIRPLMLTVLAPPGDVERANRLLRTLARGEMIAQMMRLPMAEQREQLAQLATALDLLAPVRPTT